MSAARGSGSGYLEGDTVLLWFLGVCEIIIIRLGADFRGCLVGLIAASGNCAASTTPHLDAS